MSKIYKSSSLPTTLTEVKVLQVSNPSPVPAEEESAAVQEAQTHAERMVADAEEIAQKLIDQTKAQIAEQKAKAEQEIQAWWQQKELELQEIQQQAQSLGYEAGFSEGKKEGLTAAEAEYRETIHMSREVLEQVYGEKDQIIAEAEPFLVTLSTEIARKILQEELQLNPEAVIRLVQKMILRAKERESLTVCVNPLDFPLVQNQRLQLLSMVSEQAEVKILPDSSIQQGGCIIRTTQGSLDARIDSQLDEIKTALLGLARDEKHE